MSKWLRPRHTLQYIAVTVSIYTRLCIIGNSYADKGAKWGVGVHPGAERRRKASSLYGLAYRAIAKLMVASMLESFKLRPKLPRQAASRISAPPRPWNRKDKHLTFVILSILGISASFV